MYEGTWDSVSTHVVPAWYDDAKFGVFVHWGLYSVPGWAPRVPDIQQMLTEHGPKRMLRRESLRRVVPQLHAAPGQPDPAAPPPRTTATDYPYDNFVDVFDDASGGADLDTLADLCRTAGARYVVLTTKHHDGFALWPSQVPHPVKGAYHARRDLVGELTAAVRARRMRMGLYYSGGYDWPYNGAVLARAGDALLAAPQDRRYREYVTAHVRELIDRYEPSVLWNDISWPSGGNLPELFAYYYNTGGGRRRQRPLAASPLSAQLADRAAGDGGGRPRAAAVALHPAAAQATDLLPPRHYDFRTARVRNGAHPLGAEVGTGPRRGPLLRGQPLRTARGHRERDRADPNCSATWWPRTGTS